MIKGCRETIYRKQSQLEGLLNDKRLKELDCSVQIVVPQGIVEVPATGKMDDFSGAVLLSRALIDDVNEAIQNAGQQKVKAMEKACEFRKGIIYKEWEHQKLRLRVEDLKAQLDNLEHFHVSVVKQLSVSSDMFFFLCAGVGDKRAARDIERYGPWRLRWKGFREYREGNSGCQCGEKNLGRCFKSRRFLCVLFIPWNSHRKKDWKCWDLVGNLRGNATFWTTQRPTLIAVWKTIWLILA